MSDSLPLFKAARAAVKAGTFDKSAWVEFVKAVHDQDPELEGAAIQLGITAGLVTSREEIEEALR